MRKWFLVLIAAVLTLPLFGTSVFAEEGVVYEDGEYAIKAVALKKDSDVPSGAARFINEKATLKIVDGKATLVITVPHIEMAEVTGIQIEGVKTSVTEDDAAKYMSFPLETVKTELNAQVQYEVPAMSINGDEPFRFVLEGLQEIPVVEEEPEQPEQPEEDPTPAPEQSEKPAEPEEPSTPKEPIEQEKNELDIKTLADGSYFVEASYLHNSEDKPSTMAGFLDSSIFLNVLNGKAELTVTIKDSNAIPLFTLDGKKAIESKSADNIRYETFAVSDLSTLHNGYVEYVAEFNGGVHHGKASFRIVLNENTIKKADPSQKPGINIKENPKKDPYTPPKPNPKPVEKDVKGNKETPKAPKKDDGLIPDKAYKIDYVIKHETEDRPSAADSFFVKPAILLEKDGVYYLQLTVNGSEYINSIKNKFGELVLVRENMDGSVVYQLKIGGKLTDEIILDMVLTVPGIYENQPHSARLILDPSSMKEMDASNYLLAASKNGNGPDAPNAPNPDDNDGIIPVNNLNNQLGNNKLNPNTPPKPLLDGGDKSLDKNTNSSGPNPKTGEETNIMLYMILLIASAIPLVVQLKRRFA